MIIIGAKGFAKEVLEIFWQINQMTNIVFFDDISEDLPELIYKKFCIIRSFHEAEIYFQKIQDSSFTLGIGNPLVRFNLYNKFLKIGGILKSTISPFANIGHFDNNIGEGCNIMTGAIITNSIQIGKCSLININCTIGHDCVIGEFVHIAPGAAISGNCKIGSFCTLGTNSTVLPGVTIGHNVIIGAGAVVNKEVPDNSVAVGIPAKIIKKINPLQKANTLIMRS